ncbi:unnamed protein product [Allacma fusca]|uniref:Uncharacterized protein n=1 Tax=Allacma fusca TaxID=39272 RepID=A0A8J2LR61_9HEXA|nr:unnamed protein product [Allacma fusca]
MKFLVLLVCGLVVASATPYNAKDYGRRGNRRRPGGRVNAAKQDSKAISGDNGVSISSGQASAGQHRPLGRGDINSAKQHSFSETGNNGVATSSGSANAGRVKRTVVVYNDGVPPVVPVVYSSVPAINSAKQISKAVSLNGPAAAIGSASAVSVREKRDTVKIVKPAGSSGKISIASGTAELILSECPAITTDDWNRSGGYERDRGQYEYQREHSSYDIQRDQGQSGYHGDQGNFGDQGNSGYHRDQGNFGYNRDQGNLGYDRDQGQYDYRGNPDRKINAAKQQSNSVAGDQGVAVSSGSATAGEHGSLQPGGANVAKQISNAEAGNSGVATSSGSATAGRVKRTLVVYDVGVAPVVVPDPFVGSSAQQDSIATSANGPVSAVGSATAVREKRYISSASSSGSIVSGDGVRVNTAQESLLASTDLGGASASGFVMAGGH